MHVARHGSGPRVALGAVASQVHPVFMLPPLAVSLFGGLLTGDLVLVPAALHLVVVFASLYTAHVKDGYVDFHVRSEDDDHPLTAPGCRLLLVASTGLFVAAALALGLLVDPVAALISLPCWIIGYLHAPQLDTNPVTATTGYPLGVTFALLGGSYVQAGTLSPIALAFAAVFLAFLSGIKVIDDATDVDYDRSISKRTVAVVLGPDRARLAAYALMAGGMATVVAFAAVGLFPPGTVAGVAAFAVVAALARPADPELATMLLIRGSYVFLAFVVAAVWFRPLG